jgi:hypothetical protein
VAQRAQRLLAGERGRFLAGIGPVVAIFLVAAWQATAGTLSLAAVLSFLGVIVVALLAGVFPVLLLAAARRRGELTAWGYRLPAGRWVLGAVYAISLGGVALHGLFIWDEPLQRASAFVVTALALAMTAGMVRDGVFAPRATVQLRHELETDTGRLSLVLAGRPAPAEVVLDYSDGARVVTAAGDAIAGFSALRRLSVTPDWAAAGAPAPDELNVWAHRITAEQASEPLAVVLERDPAGERFELVLEPEPAPGAALSFAPRS